MFSFSYFYLYDNISLLLYIVAINVNGFYCRFVVCFDIVVEIHIQFGRRRRFRFGSGAREATLCKQEEEARLSRVAGTRVVV